MMLHIENATKTDHAEELHLPYNVKTFLIVEFGMFAYKQTLVRIRVNCDFPY